MIYVDFRNECLKGVKQKYDGQGWNVKIFCEGDTSNKKSDIEFIRETNLKYYGNRNDAIGGDFIRMNKTNEGGIGSCARFEMRYLYDEFQKKGWDEVYKIVEVNVSIADETVTAFDDIDDYESINNRLIARPLNFEENQKSLEDKVYRKVGDFVIALYLRVREYRNNLASVKVTKDWLEKWKKSPDEALDRALENSSILYPPAMHKTVIKKLHDHNFGIVYVPFDITNDKVGERETLFCRCPNNSNGAVAFFYPGMAEKISKAFGNEDYYVVFTAISEFHLHRCGEFNPEDLMENLREINERFPNGILTDMIFRYYVDKKELQSVEVI